MPRGVPEGEIKQELQTGGYLRNVLIITKLINGMTEHLAYVRPSWRREFLPLRTWGDKGDRTYKDLDRLLLLLRDDFGYRGFIGLYLEGDPDLARYRIIAGSQDDVEPGRNHEAGNNTRP